ncbi:hypothetical protein SALBM217S_09253 [Streptomyces griseoloalbus]
MVTRVRTVTSLRRSAVSPSGAKKSSPTAYPSWATEAIQATADGVEPKSRAIRESRGAAR